MCGDSSPESEFLFCPINGTFRNWVSVRAEREKSCVCETTIILKKTESKNPGVETVYAVRSANRIISIILKDNAKSSPTYLCIFSHGA